MSEGETGNEAGKRGSLSEAQGWEESFARLLGSAARRATNEVDSFAAWTKRAIAGPPGRRRKRRGTDPVGPLLEQLAQLLATHVADEYKSLDQDPTFWSLVARLHARRPRLRAARKRRRRAADEAARPRGPAAATPVESEGGAGADQAQPGLDQAGSGKRKSGKARGGRGSAEVGSESKTSGGADE